MKIVQIVVHGHKLLGLTDTGALVEHVKEKGKPAAWRELMPAPDATPAPETGGES